MRLIYLAGAYNADTQEGIDANVNRAIEAAMLIMEAGKWKWFVHCPHAATYSIAKRMKARGNEPPRQFWLDGDLEILQMCDGLILLPGWGNSEGSISEYKTALVEMLPVFKMLKINKLNAKRAIVFFEEKYNAAN